MNTQTLERPSRSIQRLAAIQTEASEVIRSLPKLGDAELLALRNRASEIGRCAWLIECAVDAELLRRLGEKRGRGNKDVNERGLMAAAKERAEMMECEPGTIRRNAQIFNEFREHFQRFLDCPENMMGAQHSILDKTFYDAAIRSGDPHATLQTFLEAKASNPRFSTRDARKMVRRASAPDLSHVVECALFTEAARAAWADVKRALRGLKNMAPYFRGQIDDIEDDLEDLLKLPAEPLLVRILADIELSGEGGITIEELSKLINYHRDVTGVFVRRMKEEGFLVEHFRQSAYCKTAKQRGTYLYALSLKGSAVLKAAGRSAFA